MQIDRIEEQLRSEMHKKDKTIKTCEAENKELKKEVKLKQKFAFTMQITCNRIVFICLNFIENLNCKACFDLNRIL